MRALVVFLCTVAACLAQPQSGRYVVVSNERPHLSYDAAYRAGRADATRDIARDYFAVEEFGLLPVFEDEYVKLAAKRYGIHVKVLAGCIVDEEIAGHAKGYNEISQPAIERRFGKNALFETEYEAQRQWEKKH